MYFSRIRLKRGLSAARLSTILPDNEYGDHQMLWKLFEDPDKKDRDFLFRRDSEGSRPMFFALSETEPQDSSGVWLVETKPYKPALKEGDRLGFSLRANPTITRWVGDGDKKRHARHDVVMEAKSQLERERVPKRDRPTTVELAQEHGVAWLEKRAESCGFTVTPDSVRAEGYRQLMLRKKGKGRPIRLSTLDFTGVLTVTDPERFRAALFNGIGPAKGFGCGLMLIRRV
jgi:CRISPR system Cascade subunit CasE